MWSNRCGLHAQQKWELSLITTAFHTICTTNKKATHSALITVSIHFSVTLYLYQFFCYLFSVSETLVVYVLYSDIFLLLNASWRPQECIRTAGLSKSAQLQFRLVSTYSSHLFLCALGVPHPIRKMTKQLGVCPSIQWLLVCLHQKFVVVNCSHITSPCPLLLSKYCTQ